MIQRLALAAACVLLFAGCGSKMDTDAVEDEIESGIQEQAGITASVDCPSDVELNVGGEFHCIAATDDGTNVRVTVTMENDDGDVIWSVDS